MKQKGFTIMELIAAISILSILLLIAIPIYIEVSKNINESIYDTKVKKILTSAESYAEENAIFVIDVKTLIENGKIQPDNEKGEYKDPRTERSMLCDVISITYENNQYTAKIVENETCYNKQDLENLYGLVELKLYQNNTLLEEKDGWVKGNAVEVRYELKEEYQSYEPFIEEIKWNGEESKHCTKENITNCKNYSIETGEIKTVTISMQLKVVKEGVEFVNTVSKVVRIDLQVPYVLENSIIQNNDINTSSQRKVEFDLSDGDGSGLKEYAIIEEKNCNSEEYERNKKAIMNPHVTEYLKEGEYVICIQDQVGNKTSEIKKNQIFKVSKVDTTKPIINSFTISSKQSGYSSLETRLNIKASDDGGVSNLKMCISNAGYLVGCKWEIYQEGKDWTINGSLDGKKRVVYLSIQDASGNIIERAAEYTPYQECSKTNKVYTNNWTACSTACAQGYQSRNYQMKDNYTAKVCSSGVDRLNTTTYQIASSIVGQNGWYKGVNIRAVFPSGSTSGKYCVTTSGSCTPTTNLSLTNPIVSLNSSNLPQKTCTVGSGSNLSSCSCCSASYYVDKTAPTAKITTSCSGSNVIVSTSGSSDAHSGIQGYYYSNNNVNWYYSTSNAYTFMNTSNGNFYVKTIDWAGNISSVVSQARNCGPSIVKVTSGSNVSGIKGYIVPLNSQYSITLNRSSYRGNSGTFSDSYVDATLINADGQSVRTQRIASGTDGMGYSLEAVRLNDNTLFIVGNSAGTATTCQTCNTYTGKTQGLILRINNDGSMHVLDKKLISSRVYGNVGEITYVEGNLQFGVLVWRSCQTSCKDYYYRINLAADYNSFTTRSDGYANVDRPSYKIREARWPNYTAATAYNTFAISTTYLSKIYSQNLYISNSYGTSNTQLAKDKLIYTFPSNFTVVNGSHFGVNKIVTVAQDKNTSKYYYYFFKNENNNWIHTATLEGPETGYLIPYTDSSMLLSTNNALYKINF